MSTDQHAQNLFVFLLVSLIVSQVITLALPHLQGADGAPQALPLRVVKLCGALWSTVESFFTIWIVLEGYGSSQSLPDGPQPSPAPPPPRQCN